MGTVSQKELNKALAMQNKKFIIDKLEEYFEITQQKYNPKELAINALWEAKKQGRLDNLYRLTKLNFTNPSKTL